MSVDPMAVFSVVLFCCVLLNDFADGVVQNSDDENKLGVKSQGAFRTGSERRDAFRSASGRRDAVKTGSERQNAGGKSKASSPLHLDGKSFGAYIVFVPIRWSVPRSRICFKSHHP